MQEPNDNIQTLNGGEEEEEDFGYVKRDSELLEKALIRNDPPPSSSAPDDDPANKETGSNEQQVAEDESPLNTPETTGNDEQPDENVTSGTALESICEDGTAPSTEGDEQADETDGTQIRKLGGTLQETPETDKWANVYDASKRKSTVEKTKTPGKPGPGILRKMSSGILPPKQTAAAQAEQPPSKEDDLPQSFQVKYLGQRDARGLWGIKHTRRPVDSMVSAAKNLKAGTVLQIVKLVVSREGVSVFQMSSNQKKSEEMLKFYPIDTISYGVQDLVYTRVFSMIIVKEIGDLKDQHPFECHAFVCESRNGARKLTYALASAFHEYSKLVKSRSSGEDGKDGLAAVKKKFAIDLRSPEEIEADLRSPHPEDSEA